MRKLYNYFTMNTRENGEAFVTLVEDRPEWLQSAIYEAHDGDLPDDWIYEECRAVCAAIDDGVFDVKYPEDAVYEHADSRVDVYTRERFQWAADHCNGSIFALAEEEDEGRGPFDKDSMVDRLGRLQYHAIARITRIMLDAFNESPYAKVEEEEES